MKFRSFVEIKKAYKEGKLLKAKYIDLMHEVYRSLFDFSRLLRGTDISKIEITDKEVIATTKKGAMKLICNEFDKRIAPYEIINFDAYEKEYSDYILKLIKDGDTIFDIGANTGYYSIFLAKNDKRAKVYAFEPVPETFKLLKKNIRMNSIKNIRPFNFGFDKEEGVVTFYYHKEESGNASARNLNKEEKTIKIKCRVLRIDDFVKRKNIRKIDFIKCDVEGAELFVFQGGVETLKKHRPAVMVEMLRKWAREFGYHPNEMIRFFKNLGYRCFTIKKKRLNEFYIMDENTKETNFIFLP